MRELLLEIWASVSKNKLRTILTGFSVAWGIFMLVILLGSGNGLQNGIISNFGDMMVNTMEVQTWRTSKPYAGYEKGRRIDLSVRDKDILSSEFKEVRQIATRSYYPTQRMVYGDQFQSASVLGLSENMATLEGINILEGRFLNVQDLSQLRKVIVVDEITRKVLFKDASPIGEKITVGDIVYTVIGVYKGKLWANQARCYIPISTGQLIFEGNDPKINRIMFSVEGIANEEQFKTFEKSIVKRLSAEHSFDPDDQSAMWVRNNQREYESYMMVFRGINIFVWIIGLGTLIAGIVGVSNIMLVTVRERTFEFGVRKALGAKPKSIIFLILFESVLITSLFGYIGMVSGVAVMETVNYFVENQHAIAQLSDKPMDRMTMFLNPTLELSITFSATVVLVVAGLIAGYVPARRAARIKTIDALRFNK